MEKSAIATAWVQLQASADGLTDSIEQAVGSAGTNSGNTFGSKFGKAASVAGKVGIAAFAATAAATGEVINGFVKASNEVAAYGDNVDKMSQKMGISAEAYQEWDAVMQHSGTSMESMKVSMKTLANAVESGNVAFEQLGLTQEELAGMSQEQIFEATIAGLQNVEDTTQRTYLAGKLLGRGATDLGALLNMSAEETQTMRDRVHELGGVMSDEAVKAAAAYQDQLQDMTTAFDGLKNNFIAEFLPSMTTVMGGLTEIFSGNSDEGLSMVSEGVNQLVEDIASHIPDVMRVGGGIVTSLGESIIANAPQIVQSAIDILKSLVGGISDNKQMLVDSAFAIIDTLVQGAAELLPMVDSTATELILTLADGLADYAPELIPTVVHIILTIVDNLAKNLPMVVQAAIQIVTAIVQGIMNALPELITTGYQIISEFGQAILFSLPQIIELGISLLMAMEEGLFDALPQLLSMLPGMVTQIMNTFTSNSDKLAEAGTMLIKGLWNGIKSSFSKMLTQVPSLASGLVDKFKSAYGIHSPSTVFRDDIGFFLGEGVGEGWDDAMEDVTNRMMSDLKLNVPAPDMSVSAGTIKSVLTTDYSNKSVAASQDTIIIPVYFGQKKVETIVVDAMNKSYYTSGGR